MAFKKRKTPTHIIEAALCLLLILFGCSRYKQKPLPILHPSAYANSVEVFGAMVAAKLYNNQDEAKEFFGFDIVGAGVLPVQMIIDHQGKDPINIIPSQTFIIDSKGQLWNILDERMTYNRIKDKTEWGEIAPESAKGSVLGATAGALVGAAIGIVTGKSIPEAVGKGAAAGGAGGAVFGGAKGLNDPEVRKTIKDDLESQSLGNKPILPSSLSHGIIYFPAEASDARTLRLQLHNNETGETTISNFKL